ncbi:MAG: hypothetical protein ABJE66_33760 [Deltaproteobacteria bacterium]
MSEGVLDLVLGEIRTEIAAQLPKNYADVAALEAELAQARTEQKRLAKAVAFADDVAELASELKKRNQLISSLDARIIAAKRTPDDVLALVTKIETSARERLRDLRTTLADRHDLRDVFLALFPDGLTFTAARTTDGARQVWRITRSASLHTVVGEHPPNRITTPHLPTARGNSESANPSARNGVGGWPPPDCVATPTRCDPHATAMLALWRRSETSSFVSP